MKRDLGVTTGEVLRALALLPLVLIVGIGVYAIALFVATI